MKPRGPMYGWVVVDRRGRVEAGTLAYSAGGAWEWLTSRHDAAEEMARRDYWKHNGFAAVRCSVFSVPNHQRPRRKG